MHKEVFDVQICFSHGVHVLGCLKTSEEKKQVFYKYIFQLNSPLEGEFKNVTHANF